LVTRYIMNQIIQIHRSIRIQYQIITSSLQKSNNLKVFSTRLAARGLL